MMMTIDQIAKRARVSKATVSKVINGNGRISGATRERVLKVIEETGYKPRRNRRRDRNLAKLSRKKVRQVAFLVPDTHVESTQTLLSHELARCIGHELLGFGIQMVLTHLPHEDHLPSCLTNGSVEGVIVRAGNFPDELRQELRQIPTVQVLESWGVCDYADSVVPDNRLLGEAAARRLLSEGHRYCAVIDRRSRGRDGRDLPNQGLQLRALGCLGVFEQVGVPCRRREIPLDRAVEETIRALLESDPAPTGLFFTDHHVAYAGVAALQQCGIRLGREVDAVTITVTEADPILTPSGCLQIPMNIPGIARRAVQQLLAHDGRPGSEYATILIRPEQHS